MNFSSRGLLVASVLAIASVMPSQVMAQKVIKMDGSSTVFPFSEAVAAEFQKQNPGIRVTVGVSGTGAGFRKFCNGETDISNASRPISKREMETCNRNGIKYIELPVAFDGLTVVVNPQNTWATNLTVEELKRIWEPGSKINNWKDVRPGFPDVPLRLYGAGTASGTFDYFTEAIVGKAKASRTDYTASEDDNVLVQGVARDRGGLGYFGKSYYEENKDKLKAVAIVNPKTNRPVMPSDETVLDGSYQPLSRPLFWYVNAESANRDEVTKFVLFTMRNAPSLAKKADVVPLSAADYRAVLNNVFTKRKIGTVFGGEQQIGATVKEIIAKEAKE
ncbi:MAG: PstS family phosphate ABC transporter substrate-binding protein [Pseudanabaenaceae cyanobacterium SKYGB_i_bin29]|nr:PstS family phosphate ABC transporter substrate-binding protein [Pseudanabaenaceae cyanobacterium SKYG29]MDW8421512.1 PstS family phosphate ABC transporter substrate-binding protein [Pseudanabaenaceae cyanobacterium SKYGB_i_bin29]